MNYNIIINMPEESKMAGGLSAKILETLSLIIDKNNNIDNIDKINSYRIIIKSKFMNENIFDKIYLYDETNKYINLNINKYFYVKKYIHFYEPTKNYEILNKLINKNKFTPELQDKITYYINNLNIDENTIAVHIRLTDMNINHAKNYGTKTYGDYLKKIKDVIKETNVKNIFIASDNNESINKLRIDLPDCNIKCINLMRNEYENSDNYKMQIDNSINDEYIMNNFIDIYLLSRCGYLIHRISGFAQCAIIYSNSFKKCYLI